MIYTCLYFKLEIIETNTSTMRQIVDRYFSNKWVISLHVELLVDLRVKWTPFKAASNAISNTINFESIQLATKAANSIQQIHLPSGLLSVENMGDYSKLIFEYNNALRWLILHFGIFFNNYK